MINERTAAVIKNNQGIALCSAWGSFGFAACAVLTVLLFVSPLLRGDGCLLLAAMTLSLIAGLALARVVDLIRKTYVCLLSPDERVLAVVADAVTAEAKALTKGVAAQTATETTVVACAIKGLTRRDTPPPRIRFAQ